jgi:hypothetical protein
MQAFIIFRANQAINTGIAILEFCITLAAIQFFIAHTLNATLRIRTAILLPAALAQAILTCRAYRAVIPIVTRCPVCLVCVVTHERRIAGIGRAGVAVIARTARTAAAIVPAFLAGTICNA